MNKICTSLEQSKKLIELGIDVNTADMYYGYDYNSPIGGYEEDAQIIPQSEFNEHFVLFPEDIPVWSLTALLNLIQDNIKIEKTLFDQSDMFTHSIIGDAYEYHSHEHKNLVDAAFEMVCWLLETGEL